MIYGIGPNPMADDFNDEDSGDLKVSPYHVYVCDKQTWDKDGHCNDSCVDQKMREKLERVGFAESMESIFEPLDISVTKAQIRSAMENIRYVYNEEFEKFMESSFG